MAINMNQFKKSVFAGQLDLQVGGLGPAFTLRIDPDSVAADIKAGVGLQIVDGGANDPNGVPLCDVLAADTEVPFGARIYDLKNGQIYVHNFHNYEEYVIFDTQNEIDKGGAYYKLPELFNQTKLLSPSSEELVSAIAVNFLWNGEADSYQLCVSQDSTFSDCITIEVTDSGFHRTDNIILCSLWFPLILIGGLWSRRTNILVLLSLLLGLYLMSCSIEGLLSPYSPSTKEHSQTVENLEGGHKYYWKVETVVGDGIICVSKVESFRTE